MRFSMQKISLILFSNCSLELCLNFLIAEIVVQFFPLLFEGWYSINVMLETANSAYARPLFKRKKE